MNAKSDKLGQSYSGQLTEFAEKLQKQIADEDLLDDIHGAIEDLLWDNEGIEADIRRILQEQHKAGNLRDETFELVQRMLDRMVTELIEIAPGDPEPEEQRADPFGDTVVIEAPTFDEEPDRDRLQVGSVLGDRFLLQEKIADGSMGVVYKALDRRLAKANGVNPSVAIKVLAPQLSRNGDALRALQQEAAKGRCLAHPNIMRFIDLDRDDDQYFIVMEWLDGKSLADILDDSSSREIDKDTALDIVRRLAKALDYAHRRGVVHADVKPGNIMLLTSGEVKLLEFGIARVRQKQSQGQADFDPSVLGAVTPAYSSMQVLTGEEPAAADDVFSLGCVMYRLIAGYRVFGPRNAAEAADAGMEPQRPQGLDDVEWAALRKALSYSRVSRFASPQDFVDALATSVPVHATQPVPQLDEPEFEGRRLWPSLLAAAVVVGGVWGLFQFGLLDQIASVSLPGMTANDNQNATIEQSPPAEPVANEELLAEDVDSPSDDGSLVAEASEELLAEDVDSPSDDGSLVAEANVELLAEDVDSPIDDGSLIAETNEELLAEDVDSPSDDGSLIAETNDDTHPEEELIPEDDLIDFSTLPPASLEIRLAFPGTARTELDLTLREDEEPVIVDLVRESNTADALVVKLEEVAYNGNRSPWEAGQYQISDDSVVRFPPGQDRARFTVSMTPDPLREPDRQVSLLVRDIEDSESAFALINLRLEDDDQRRFESGFEPNTVAFVEDHLLVSERDPAVQIHLVRYNPDQTTLRVKYSLHEVTAIEGEDYFVPGNRTVLFGPGQRSARILVPLVQDSRPEIDEVFVLEMPDLQSEMANANIFRRIAVMIRDDDSKLE